MSATTILGTGHNSSAAPESFSQNNPSPTPQVDKGVARLLEDVQALQQWQSRLETLRLRDAELAN